MLKTFQMTLTIKELLSNAFSKLKDFSDSPRLDAEILLSAVLKISRFELFSKYDNIIEEKDKTIFFDFIQRRIMQEPVAYIIKEKTFFEDTFFVDKRVLVPRPETEFLVLAAIEHLKKYLKKTSVLDLCCGSGCVGLSVLRVIDCKLVLSDLSNDALDVAKINLEKLFVRMECVDFIESNLFENIKEKYDVVTANPPYLSKADMTAFVNGPVKYEPENALFGGETGFEISEKILSQVHNFLNPGGIVAVELGYEGSKYIRNEYTRIKLEKIIKDYSGIDRIAVFNLCKL